MTNRFALLSIVLAFLLCQGCKKNPDASTPPAVFGDLQIDAVYPHDTEAFTQGLLFHGGALFESTGGYGASEVRKVALESGIVLQRTQLSEEVFGEGLAFFGDQLFQLTWKSQEGFRYEITEGALLAVGRFEYAGQGWGLTHDGTQFIMSNGSSELQFMSSSDFTRTAVVTVTDKGRPLSQLNELEYIDGFVFANVLANKPNRDHRS